VQLEQQAASSSPTLAQKATTELVATQLLDLVFPSIYAASERILTLGIEGAPDEVCGIMVNEPNGVRLVQLANRSETPTDSYRIDPQTIRQLTLQPDSWKHIAIWHTHPGGRVGPSPMDIQHKIPGIHYLVVTVPTGECRWF
jgi:proteasome lid subunit RPN8/RPN11